MDNQKIFKAMLDIQDEVDALVKDRVNKAQGFRFRGIDDAYNFLQPLFKKHRVMCPPAEILEHTFNTYERVGANGKTQNITKITAIVKYRFYADDGSYVEAQSLAEAEDYGDKCANKVMAFAHKTVLIQSFAIPTDESYKADPDKENKDEALATAKALLAEIELYNGDDKEAIREGCRSTWKKEGFFSDEYVASVRKKIGK